MLDHRHGTTDVPPADASEELSPTLRTVRAMGGPPFGFRGRVGLAVALAAVLATMGCEDVSPLDPSGARPNLTLHNGDRTTVETLLALTTGPVAIAHRGMGANLGDDPSRPIENTVAGVRQAFEAGASVVELDLQMTRDGEIVAWHDDFLDDYTCIATLTREELELRAPHIPSLQAILRTALRYNSETASEPRGLLTVDLKPTSPLCDPDDATGPTFVSAVIDIVRRMGASDIVYFNSMSPALLELARVQAPEIPRQLTLLFLQLLSPEQVQAALGLPVTLIDRSPDFGLRWGEIGVVYRLPGYDSVEQAIGTAHAVGARIISYDLALLRHMESIHPGSAATLVAGTRATGLTVYAGDVRVADDWHFGASVGAQALYTDDIPLALSLQPPLQ